MYVKVYIMAKHKIKTDFGVCVIIDGKLENNK